MSKRRQDSEEAQVEVELSSEDGSGSTELEFIPLSKRHKGI